jgi:hypothetical protein
LVAYSPPETGFVADYSRSLCQSHHQRRCSLDTAAFQLAEAERLPFTILSFLLLGLPLMFDPALLTDRGALLWWMKGWTPVWAVATCIVYAYFYLPRVPAQVASAAIDAMEQVEPDAELVPVRERVETPCPLLLQVTDDVRHGETAVQKLVAERRERRRQRLRDGEFPSLRFIPRFSSSRDSSE